MPVWWKIAFMGGCLAMLCGVYFFYHLSNTELFLTPTEQHFQQSLKEHFKEFPITHDMADIDDLGKYYLETKQYEKLNDLHQKIVAVTPWKSLDTETRKILNTLGVTEETYEERRQH